MQAVVDLLALDLRRDPGELGVLVRLQLLDPDRVRGLVEDVPRDRPRPVGHEPQLDERRAAVLLRLAVEGERVGVRPELRGREVVERPRVPDLVLRDRREGDVLLEERRDPRPLGVAPAEDQLVVGELKEQLCPLAVQARCDAGKAGASASARSVEPTRARASFSLALIE